MPVFWLLFWGYFLVFPVLFGLSRLTKSKGRGASQTHNWVYARSGGKYRDASVREAWEHNHRGKSWEQHQTTIANGCLIVLLLLTVVLTIPLISGLLRALGEGSKPPLFNYFSPLLGTLSGAGYLFLSTKAQILPGPKDMLIVFILDLLSILSAVVLIVGGIILTLSNRPLPFSHHWIWLPLLFPLAVMGVMYLLSIGATKQMKKQDQKYHAAEEALRPPDMLSEWAVHMVMKLIEAGGASPPAGTENVFKFHAKNMLDSTFTIGGIVADRDFFLKTEALLSALAHGERINITLSDVYKAREDLIRAAQVIYLYGINHGGYSMNAELKNLFKS